MFKRGILLLALFSIVTLIGCNEDKISSSHTTNKKNETSETTKRDDNQNGKYKVIFKCGDIILEEKEYEKGKTPNYSGKTPTKEDEGEIVFTFIGWDKPMVPVFKDTIYEAQFEGGKMENSFIDLEEVYYPYTDKIREYLESNDRVELYTSESKGYKGITINFKSNYKSIDGYNFYYGLKDDYSDAKVIFIEAKDRKVNLYNLLKDETYYIKLTSVSGLEETGEIKSSFKTTNLGPRPIRVNGIDNVRDLGGYVTGDSVTLQNLLFRGSEMNGPHNLELTESGQRVMSEELGIKLDLDLRGESEAGYITESPINNAEYKILPLTSYDDIFFNSNTKKTYREIFKELSDISNYPIYFHCWGGADRTGTLAFMINAFLGVKEEELIKDYEYTTFSTFGLRSQVQGAAGQRFYEFLEEFHKLDGNTPKEKAISYLKSIGVTDTELYNFNAIMHGEELIVSITCPTEFSPIFEKELSISGNLNEVKEVFINDVSKAFKYESNKVTIDSKLLIDLPNGLTNGKIVFNNGKEASFSFEVKKLDYIDVSEMSGFDGELNVTDRITLDTVCGYDKYVKARIQTETKVNGGVYMLIGSYGFLLRGGLFRFINMSSGGVITDLRIGPSASFDLFNSPKDLYLKINVHEKSVGFDIYVVSDTKVSHYEYECVNAKLSSGEIESEDAKVTFDINKTDIISLKIISSDADPE